MLRTLFLLLATLSLTTASSGCAKRYIPNTTLVDNPAHRQVLLFCESYRHAMEEKDISRLLSMISPRYFENGGNSNPADDLDYEGIKKFLHETFLKTTAIRYEIKYRKITFTPSQRIWVDYTYTASYKVPGPEGENWKHTVADNRLELVRFGDTFKILEGL